MQSLLVTAIKTEQTLDNQIYPDDEPTKIEFNVPEDSEELDLLIDKRYV